MEPKRDSKELCDGTELELRLNGSGVLILKEKPKDRPPVYYTYPIMPKDVDKACGLFDTIQSAQEYDNLCFGGKLYEA